MTLILTGFSSELKRLQFPSGGGLSFSTTENKEQEQSF